jgi:hypothetical protein
VKALQQHGPELTQAGWLQTVEQMAASLVYADYCQRCGTGDVHWPFRVRVRGDHLRGEYHCYHCGHTWFCGYAVNVGVLA